MADWRLELEAAARDVVPREIEEPRRAPGPWLGMTLVGRDLRYAWRSFLKDRTFTTAAVTTLALCLAANVVVFTLVNAVLLDAVDVPEPRALVLSAVGLYGVLAYLVAQRTHEIGIRMALGGSAPAIAGLVLRESVTVVAAGLVLGLAGAAWLGRALASEVFEVQPLDPTSEVVAVGLLMAAALAATAAPARRALRVDPSVTLIAE